jgi:thioredoxin-like negative regulator of GroEL
LTNDRLSALERMLESRPDDMRLRFGLAMEYQNAGRPEDAVRELRAYLAASDDEGNAWGRLASTLRALGKDDEAKDAYRTGIEVAQRHGHPTMAEEFEAALEGWDP